MVELKDRLKTLDRNTYVNKFINEFQKYFPNIYTNEQLNTILNKEVYGVFLCDGDIDKGVVGGYYSEFKSVVITNPNFDAIAFHEFIHALRNNYSFYNQTDVIYTSRGFEKHNFDDGIEEAFTELISCIYEYRKNNINDKSNCLKVFHKNSDLGSYEMIAIIANEINYLAKITNKNKDLVNDFLLGKDIRKEIYYIINSFIKKIKHNNEYSDKELSDLAYQLAYYYIEFILYMSNSDNDIVELAFIIEKINRSIDYTLNQNKEDNIVDYSLYKRIFTGDDLKKHCLINNYDINNLNDDISLMVNFLDNYSSRKLIKKDIL